jgi:hypothetical protein
LDTPQPVQLVEELFHTVSLLTPFNKVSDVPPTLTTLGEEAGYSIPSASPADAKKHTLDVLAKDDSKLVVSPPPKDMEIISAAKNDDALLPTLLPGLIANLIALFIPLKN